MLRSADSSVIGGQQILYLRRDPMACVPEGRGMREVDVGLEQYRLSEAPRRILIPT